MKRMLALETSAETCSVALDVGGEVREFFEHAPMKHAELILPAVSGLLADAGHIAAASGVKLLIDHERVPLSPALRSYDDPNQALRWALTGGEDYELCFCLPPGESAPEGCICIGQVEEGAGVDCGMPIDIPPGYQHF